MKISIPVTLALLCVPLMLPVSTHADVNLVINGSFEVPGLGDHSVGPGRQQYNGPSTDIPGWTVEGIGDVFLAKAPEIGNTADPSFNFAQDGEYYLDLSGGGGLHATVFQDIATVPLTPYRLSFHISAADWVPPAATIKVRITGASTLLDTTLTPLAPGANLNWTLQTFVFVADSTTTRLGFVDTSSSDDNSSFVDSISVVPQPPTFSSLVINGPASVDEDGTAQYTATATFSDTSTQGVDPIWSADSPTVSITAAGLLSAGEVPGDATVLLSASRTLNGVTLTATKSITILNTLGPPPGTVVVWGDNTFGQLDVPPNLAGVVAVSGGDLHSLALKGDGTVVAWGFNFDGQSTVPGGLTGVIAVAAGGVHSMALKSDGTVVGWGYNGQGQATVPGGLNGVVAIAAGYAHNLALRNDGTVVAWGDNGNGQANVPGGLDGVVAVSAGTPSLALKSDGTVVAWGYNKQGEATVPAGLGGVIAISAGLYHSLALKGDGTVVAWGAGMTPTGDPEIDFGQSIVPVGLAGIVAVSAGGLHSLALKGDGKVVGWGRTAGGGAATVPTGLGVVLAVSGGGYHSLALLAGEATPPTAQTLAAALVTDHSAILRGQIMDDGGRAITERHIEWAKSAGGWGAGTPGVDHGFIADASILISGSEFRATLKGLSPNTAYEYRVSAANPAGISPATSMNIVPFTTSNPPSLGMVVAWGRNDQGQATVPAGLNGVIAVAAGERHTVAMRSDGTVIGWGINDYGQLDIPAGLTGVIAITAFDGQTMALTEDGKVVAWGRNEFGESDVPGGLGVVTAISAGATHSVALKLDGTVVAWGRDEYGQSDVPVGLGGVRSIAAGQGHTVALKLDGTVVAWGNNAHGQTTPPGGLGGVKSIAAGEAHSVALKNDGTVVAWGLNDFGQTTVPAGLNGVTAIAAGGRFSLALKTDGTVVAWGSDEFGQRMVPAGLSGVTAIVAGAFHDVALTKGTAPLTATALAQVVNGFVVGATVTGGGFGYDVPPVVLLIGGGGTGASALTTVENGAVTHVTITNPGSGYATPPLMRIASPPFSPQISIEVSRVRVHLKVILGSRYLIEGSVDLTNWIPAGDPFLAQDEQLTQEFEVDVSGRYYRLLQVQ